GAAFDLYNTAVLLRGQTFGLVLAGKLDDEFSSLLKEKNVLGIDDSNTLLRKIIGGCDAPFVYEKLGVRFEHFLLDEFQDTSVIQWENFQPLLKESDSNHRDNLIVGDVKQSIYRWRGSDWHLMASELDAQFPQAITAPLLENWRSCANVVNFNNEFFKYAAAEVIPDGGLYDDVVQTSKADDVQKGQVTLTFCKKEEELRAVLDSVKDAHDRGAGFGDIAVLVRSNREGGDVADYLRTHEIPVVSDDSLNIKASLTVRRLVSLLSFVDNPQDSINGYLASSLGIESPDKCISLVDLSESLLRDLEKHDPDLYNKETLYIQSFMDILQDWCSINGNSLVRFLKHWDELETPCLSSPEDADAVRIMTIHKSKGLEFPHVIFPFAESVIFYKWGWHWCAADDCQDALPSSAGSIYPVSLSEKAGRSLFSRSLELEKNAQMVDNLNTFYVAFTRAVKSLHVIACTPPASVQSGKPMSNFSQVLHQFASASHFMSRKLAVTSEDEVFESGDPYDFSLMERKAVSKESDFPCSFHSYPLEGRLKLSSDAADFFGEEGKTGPEASNRLNGIVLHDILSSVKYPSDLESAVNEAVYDGRLTEAEGEDDLNLLRARISSVADMGWFPENDGSAGFSVLNEETIIDSDGQVHRPDRVVSYPDRTIIIDYKFGAPKKGHRHQILTYMDIYKRLGFSNIRGYLWYISDNIAEEII
ncbi:MAG: 3'-5' exonuclease, partial [Bacteroidia bacterium]|nr:3'-5' exonuclease [Bacteroidia bacterium]